MLYAPTYTRYNSSISYLHYRVMYTILARYWFSFPLFREKEKKKADGEREKKSARRPSEQPRSAN